MTRKIIVYTQPDGWHVCEQAKEYLSRRNVPFVERDIMNDQTAMDELLEIGVLTTPVTVINGEIVVGFDRSRFETLLGE